MLLKFFNNLKISLLLTFCTGIFILIFGVIVAIYDNYSTQILQDLFVILPFSMLIVLLASLYSAYRN